MPATRWIGPAVVLAGLAILCWVSLSPQEHRSYAELGLLHVFRTFDQGLPLAAAGAALSRLSPRSRLVSLILIASAVALGLVTRSVLLPAIGPMSLIVGGISLALPAGIRNRAVPILLAFVGIAFGMTLSFDAPEGINRIAFMGAAILAGSWLVTAFLVVCGSLQETWIRIANPILGSWLIAIGLMLGGTMLLPRPIPDAPPVVVQPPSEIEQLPQP